LDARLARRADFATEQAVPANDSADAGEAVAPDSGPRAEVSAAENAGQRPALLDAEGAPNAWPDESVEVAMLSDLRTRGEPLVAAKAAAPAVADEKETANLPPLGELVARIPAEVRATLDELFRARFTAVRRVPARVLKAQA
jgi:hypothetical protein